MGKIQLKDGTCYNISDGAAENRFEIILDGASASDILAKLTENNLSEIRFLTDTGEVNGINYQKMLCSHSCDGDTLTVVLNDADLCRYGLILNEEGRIVQVIPKRYAPDDAVLVDKLPDGAYVDYLYVNGEYICEPLQGPENGASVWDELDAAYQEGYSEGYQEGVNGVYDK